MLRNAPTALFFALLILLPLASDASLHDVCQHYKIDAPKRVIFNANEKKLICGDPDASSWENIPRFQAEYFITTFLQERGYFFPTFTEDGDDVVIHPGEMAKISEIDVTGTPPEFFDVTRRRRIRGKTLTPSILTTLEDWTSSQMKQNGFACPTIHTTADPKTGIVKLNVDPGPYQTIAEVIEEPVKGLRPGTLARYRAFNIGDRYDSRNLALTSNRIELVDGILQSSYFSTKCTADGAVLTQKSLAGPKRLLTIGLGASTEDYLIGKLGIQWTRIGLNGSSIKLSARGSFRKQWLFAQGFIYVLPKPTRWHLNPFASTQRRDETQYEYTAVDAGMPVAVTWDTQDVGFLLRFGPKYNFTRTYKGAAKGDTHFASAMVRLEVASHDYHYYFNDPRSGFFANVLADFNSDHVGSSVTAQRLQVTGEALWNIGRFDPPLFVIGVRGLAGTTLTDTGSVDFARLPPQFLYYLGGSQTMRGFSRFNIPKQNRGALTALYAGLEARLANALPLNFQPLAFVDFGATGQKSLNLGFPVYWSPGFGIRWPSFIGVFRMTFGYGLFINNNNPANDSLKGWQFYWSFGEEF